MALRGTRPLFIYITSFTSFMLTSKHRGHKSLQREMNEKLRVM